MKNIFICAKLAEAGINFLNDQQGQHLHIQTGRDEQDLCDIIGNFDVKLIRSDTNMTQQVLQSGKRLKPAGPVSA